MNKLEQREQFARALPMYQNILCNDQPLIEGQSEPITLADLERAFASLPPRPTKKWMFVHPEDYNSLAKHLRIPSLMYFKLEDGSTVICDHTETAVKGKFKVMDEPEMDGAGAIATRNHLENITPSTPNHDLQTE